MQEPMADVAAHEAVRQSMVGWIVDSLGMYVLVLPLAALVTFGLCLVVVLRSRSAWGGAAVCLLVPVPLLLSLFGALQGAMASFTVIAGSDASPKPSDLAAGISSCLVIPFVGLLLTAPGYVVAAMGVLARSFAPEVSDRPDERPTQSRP